MVMRLPNAEPHRGREHGSAMIEFMLLAIVLIVPLSLGMVDVSNYFSALMAGQSAAVEAARAYSLTPSAHLGAFDAQAIPQAIAQKVMADSGIHYRNFQLKIVCSATPCLTPGASIKAIVDFRANLRTLSRPIHVEEIEPVDAWVVSR
jgi:Flp pilus assembly protein TadG